MFIDVFHCYYWIFDLNEHVYVNDKCVSVCESCVLPSHPPLIFRSCYVVLSVYFCKRTKSSTIRRSLPLMCCCCKRLLCFFVKDKLERQKKLKWECLSLVVKGDTVDKCQFWFWSVILEISNPSLTSLPIDERNTLSHTPDIWGMMHMVCFITVLGKYVHVINPHIVRNLELSMDLQDS